MCLCLIFHHESLINITYIVVQMDGQQQLSFLEDFLVVRHFLHSPSLHYLQSVPYTVGLGIVLDLTDSDHTCRFLVLKVYTCMDGYINGNVDISSVGPNINNLKFPVLKKYWCQFIFRADSHHSV